MAETVFFYDEETDENIQFYVVEEVRINNVNYVLVTDSEEDEATAYILKEVSVDENGDSVYEMVSEDDELEYIGRVFDQVLDDIDITNE